MPSLLDTVRTSRSFEPCPDPSPKSGNSGASHKQIPTAAIIPKYDGRPLGFPWTDQSYNGSSFLWGPATATSSTPPLTVHSHPVSSQPLVFLSLCLPSVGPRVRREKCLVAQATPEHAGNRRSPSPLRAITHGPPVDAVRPCQDIFCGVNSDKACVCRPLAPEACGGL